LDFRVNEPLVICEQLMNELRMSCEQDIYQLFWYSWESVK